MSSGKTNARGVDMSYHPRGFDESASLMRARKPYNVRNLITGGAIVAFIASVYIYSISAVKQDDFSDVVDLLPPEAERKFIRSIEDEEKDKRLGVTPETIVVDKVAPPAPAGPTGVMAYLPRRLHDIEWIKTRGWVEEGKGNVLVWGAPNVDNVGKLHDAANSRGTKRQV
ncbi:uncharacterized protein EHS24_006242 [Apiotrichum porosum]|uniref:Cytochrome c oxidase assembly factor 3 n=1 Tax=Apiotrichum porosum TaxID=105984 RepID=A0A427Y0S4_9TREE|nr:uncharacterized protein EHS24_006242 [Apiotrichum porosum]RSH84718.1 hypothetical protein EHS24_006242 [Apiotrichum porosum]